MFSPTDVTVILGQRGCGKSTLGRKIASVYPRLVVIDRLREWGSGDVDFSTDRFDSFALYLRDALQKNFPKFRCALQFEVEQVSKEAVFSQAMRLCYKFGEISRRNLAVLIEEVHHFATPHRVDHWLFESVMTGRHSNQAIICSSQRPASVSKALVSQAHHVFLGQMFERNDIAYVADIIGDASIQLPQLKVGEFLHYQPGKKIVKINNKFR